jgi:RNA polymerase sporulation-specific sigma factor
MTFFEIFSSTLRIFCIVYYDEKGGIIMFFEFLNFVFSKLIFFTGAIVNKGSFPTPLSSLEESECIKKMREGDNEAREKLITHNMRLVAHVVKKYSGTIETDDLISVGTIGLIKAVNTFDPSKGNQLATFAARCIENEILMLLRANKKFKNDISLNDSVGFDKDGNEMSLIDLLYDGEDQVFYKVDKEIEVENFLNFIKGVLTEREYKVICLRFGLKGGYSYAQREVASFLKISRSYISRIEKKAIEKLKIAVKKSQFYC